MHLLVLFLRGGARVATFLFLARGEAAIFFSLQNARSLRLSRVRAAGAGDGGAGEGGRMQQRRGEEITESSLRRWALRDPGPRPSADTGKTMDRQ